MCGRGGPLTRPPGGAISFSSSPSSSVLVLVSVLVSVFSSVVVRNRLSGATRTAGLVVAEDCWGFGSKPPAGPRVITPRPSSHHGDPFEIHPAFVGRSTTESGIPPVV